jgi:oxygen-independent coproporphyrinogen-3 oxidase
MPDPGEHKVIPGLYIHTPFCISKCCYCNFYSVTSLDEIPFFVDALIQEVGMYRYRFDTFDTIYFGGGTPSMLTFEQMEKILQAIQSTFAISPKSEITIETNPGDIDRAYLKSLRKLGFNRLNVGVQSFDDTILDFLGRRHSSSQAIDAVDCAREAGFRNIGLDLIYGVPGQDINRWIDTLRKALSLKPDHLSCYELTVEEDTPLGKRKNQDRIILPGESLQYDFFMQTSEMLEDAGYIHYEVSNFARGNRFTSRHNQKYWNHTPYLGLGPSAHSFSEKTRWWNHSSIERYLHNIAAGNRPVEGAEPLDMENLRTEALFLGLRTAEGIKLSDFSDRYDYDLLCEKKEMLETLEENGLIEIINGYIAPTRRGLALTDSLALI